jgi:hypothetical protein
MSEPTGKKKRVFVVQAGEEFEVHIAGPNQNIADPTGIIGGSTFEFSASQDRELLQKNGYKIVYEKGALGLTRIQL